MLNEPERAERIGPRSPCGNRAAGAALSRDPRVPTRYRLARSPQRELLWPRRTALVLPGADARALPGEPAWGWFVARLRGRVAPRTSHAAQSARRSLRAHAGVRPPVLERNRHASSQRSAAIAVHRRSA